MKEVDASKIKLFSEDHGVISLKIRSFEDADAAVVKKICNDHIRSSCLTAVSYYLASNIEDLFFLFVIGLLLMSFKKCLLGTVLYNVYLFCRSRFEVERYIANHNSDLNDVRGYYMREDGSSHFWVAEITRLNDERREVVGCVGLLPYGSRHGKAVRLIVCQKYRRLKIGSELLMRVEEYASSIDYRLLLVFTNSLNPMHAKFVIHHGYTLVTTVPRGLMRGDLLIWRKVLATNMEWDEMKNLSYYDDSATVMD